MAAVLGLTMFVGAQAPKRVLIEAIIISSEKYEKVLLLGVTKTNIYYVKNAREMNTLSRKRSEIDSVYIMEPAEYSEAMALLEDRKYGEAYIKFGEVAERYKKFQPFKDNHHTLAEFYQLECLRKQFKIAELVAAVADYRSENLVRTDLLQQIEVYKFWKAYNSKSWAHLDHLAKEWEKKRVPISHRAQISFCHAAALDALGRKNEALNMYGKAMTADYSKSEEILRKAAYGALGIYKGMPDVATAMKLWKSENENKYSSGYQYLIEANALARLYVKAGMGSGVDLPKEYAEFLKFTPDGALGVEQ